MKEFLHHFFIPRESNNHRPKIFHHKSLLLLVVTLFVSQIFLSTIKENFSQVLGEATDLSVEQLLVLTNQKRQAEGKSTLVLNSQLSQAAGQKADDMFSKNYWAHYAPDGTSPWIFIKNSGYEYIYAGENLARGFTTSSDVIDAWMNSPTHKENMLSSNYQEIGFAIVEGKLNGEDTILVVEMFGSRDVSYLAENKPDSKNNDQVSLVPTTTLSPVENKAPVLVFANSDIKPVENKRTNPFIESSVISKNISILILGILIVTLIVDMVIIKRKNIIRVVGHNIDHIVFFVMIFLFVLFVSKGAIL